MKPLAGGPDATSFRSVFRVFVLVKIDPVKETRLMFPMTDLPLLGFHLLMV